MNNFIVLFEEKEGTSPLVRLLDNFERVSLVPFGSNLISYLSLAIEEELEAAGCSILFPQTVLRGCS